MQRSLKHALALTTFVVAFASIVYELVFAQALSVVFGATVVNYALTIGFFLFFLGVGAWFFDVFLQPALSKRLQHARVFVWVELAIIAVAIMGMFWIFWLSPWVTGEVWWRYFIFAAAYVPVIAVGFLSGIELPLLTQWYGQERYARILALDYFGSLLGTVIYALVLYPIWGLLHTTVMVAALNFAVAVMWWFWQKQRSLFAGAILAIFLFLLSFYAVAHERITTLFQQWYLGSMIQQVYAEYGVFDTAVSIQKVLTTPYQQVIWYRIIFNASTAAAQEDTCLNLDRHIQACGNWTKAYHHGLIEVPLSLTAKENLRVLVLGGGDFIPPSFMQETQRRFAVIDLVDIDAAFQQVAQTDSFLRQFNRRALHDEKITVYAQDALLFLRRAAREGRQYDMVFIDLPGAKSEKMLPLYSVEFFTLLRNVLAPDGFAVSWYYPEYMYPQHAQVLQQTLRAAGFRWWLRYIAYNPPTDQKTERFFILTPRRESDTLPHIGAVLTPYVARYLPRYQNIDWEEIPSHPQVRPHSIFRPNYALLVGKPEKQAWEDGL